jgi:uncharacterized membrane protein YgaE (UPF0421/DUF939 family)
MDTAVLDTLFETYQKEIVEDIKVDELSLKDKAMLVPTIKHKWVGRLMTHKAQLRKLNDLKKKTLKKISSESPIPLSKSTLEQAAENNESVIKIQESIDRLEVIIEYLEKVEKLTSSLTWDCKNLIDLQKLETT